jgi:hypothetical protein
MIVFAHYIAIDNYCYRTYMASRDTIDIWN